MIIGIPKEIKQNEKRVSLLPHSVSQIAKLGHKVVVQKGAGMESGISDKEFENEGASILKDINSVYNESDVIIKVKEPLDIELDLIKDSQIIFTFFHFAADKKLLSKFIETNAIAVAYETVEDLNGNLPLLTPMSEIFESFCVDEIPVTILLFIMLDFFVISVPGFFINEDLTSMSILFNLASWIETGCITLAPSDAISNISSYEITLIFLALFSLFGSVV